MKILMVNSVYAPHFLGGAEISVQALAEGITRLGEEVVVLTLALSNTSRCLTINGVKAIYLNIRNIYHPFDPHTAQAAKPFWHALDSYNIFNQKQLRNIIQSEKPDIIHSHSLAGISVALWGTASSFGIPIVHTLRDHYLLCPRTTMNRGSTNCQKQCLDCRIYSAPKKAASAKVTGVIGISKYILMRHIDAGYFRKAPLQEVIYNIQEIPVHIERRQREVTRPLRYGYLGRLHPTKGIEELLQEFPGDQELWIGGQGAPDYNNTLRSKHSCPNIHFLGHVDPGQFLQHIDVLIVPSIWSEPFGRVIIEAYAHGVPVIASHRGGIPEIVEDGVTGYLYQPENPGELAALVQRLSSSEKVYRSMRQAALEKIRDFTPEDIVHQQMRFYQKVLA